MNLTELTNLNHQLQAAIRREDLDTIKDTLLDMCVCVNTLRNIKHEEWRTRQIEQGLNRCEEAHKERKLHEPRPI